MLALYNLQMIVNALFAEDPNIILSKPLKLQIKQILIKVSN